MIQYLKRMDMNEYDEPPDGEVAELVTVVRVYGNQGAWRERHWDIGEQVCVSVPRYPDFSLNEPGEFHQYPKDRVFIISPQKSPEDLEQMLADAYLDNPDLKRLHYAEADVERLRGLLKRVANEVVAAAAGDGTTSRLRGVVDRIKDELATK